MYSCLYKKKRERKKIKEAKQRFYHFCSQH